MTELKPQEGKQEQFLSCPADICIYGGEAGGGKSYGLLLEPLHFITTVKGFGAVFFRRESGQITNEGGLWDNAIKLYSNLDCRFVENPKHKVIFRPFNNVVTFSHLQLVRHVAQWDGSELALICWDELQHFEASQFWYMFSRNRSTCGVKPYIRATCNPNPDSFLLQLLEWWIDQKTGWPIEERSGVIRYMVRIDGVVKWADTEKELKEKFPDCLPKSFTFISAGLKDNKILLDIDPNYKSNIDAMLPHEKLRLSGNWFARPTAGELFKRHYFEIIEDFDRRNILRSMRYWDRASTVPNDTNTDPDYTAGVLMHEMVGGYYIIEDVARDRLDPADVEDLIDSCLQVDGEDCTLGLEQEMGASGKAEVSYYVRRYPYHDVQVFPKTKSKLVCWKPVAIASKNKKIKLLKGDWNKDFLTEAESVTDGSQKSHDDQMDAFAGVYSYFNSDDFGMATL